MGARPNGVTLSPQLSHAQGPCHPGAQGPPPARPHGEGSPPTPGPPFRFSLMLGRRLTSWVISTGGQALPAGTQQRVIHARARDSQSLNMSGNCSEWVGAVAGRLERHR